MSNIGSNNKKDQQEKTKTVIFGIDRLLNDYISSSEKIHNEIDTLKIQALKKKIKAL